MSLATFLDANAWLDESKLKFEDTSDSTQEADNADTMVKAYLGDVYPDHVDLWIAEDEDNPTPKIIREAAALLMAAYKERKVYAINELGTPFHAQWLEEKAISILTDIRTGVITVTELPGVGSTGELSQDDFWPNDTTEVLEAADGRKFSMGMDL